jgi:hypothetical protein
MPSWYLFLGTTSALILIALLVSELLLRRYRHRLNIVALLSLLVIVAALIFSEWSVTPNIEAKGETSGVQWIMVALMYIAMTLGIVAQTYYFRSDAVEPGFTSWIKPALASPIIFIPLLSSYQDTLSTIDQISLAEIMILLVSFQNGFFWKVIFDKQTEVMAKRQSDNKVG